MSYPKSPMYHYNLNGILSSPMDIGRAPEERVDTWLDEGIKAGVIILDEAAFISKPKREISYMEAVVSDRSFNEIVGYCKGIGLPVTVDNMHCTLLYSVKQPGFKTDPSIYPLSVRVSGWDMFDDNEGKRTVLVLNLDSPELEARRVELMKIPGATKEREVYMSHITIAKGQNETEVLNTIKNKTFILNLNVEFVAEAYEEFTET